MAVASASKEKSEILNSMDHSSSSPDSSATKPDSDDISFSSSLSISQELGDRSFRSEKAESPAQIRKEADVLAPLSSRSEEYRQLFHLPPEEVLLQDFNCAYMDNILLQGHMYLFLQHICFYSNIFGFETKKIIPFHEVTCVRKAKTAGIFPNAIEIVAGERKNFFASFLSRDEAYRVIVDGWSQCSNAKCLSDCQDPKSDISSQDNIVMLFERLKTLKRPGATDLNSVDRNKETEISGECKQVSNNEGNIDELNGEALMEVHGVGEEEKEPIAQAECLLPAESFIWKQEDVCAPKIPDYYKLVAEAKFPIQVEGFFNLFFADSAVELIDTFHNRCGDKNFRCSRWYQHEKFGHARDVSFEHPIKFYFGARFARCQEVQKFRVYKDGHLVIETSQQMNDVPYGDYFRVEGLWDVEKDESESCTLRVYINVSFSKKTMWRAKIEQSTAEECKEAFAIWINNAHDFLKQKEHVAEIEGVAGLTVNGLQNNVVPKTVAMLPFQTASEGFINDVTPQIGRNVQVGSSSDNSMASLFKESCASLFMFLKSQNKFALILVIAFVSILVLMQLSIIILLTVNPRIHLIQQESYINNLGSERAETVAWLEKRIHHLKDEMLMVEARLEKMHLEYQSLKAHLQTLERSRFKS